MVSFWCTNCGKTMNANDKDAGKKCKCPGCGKINAIPLPKPAKSVEQTKPVPVRTPKPSEPRPKSPSTTPVISKVTPVRDSVSEAKRSLPPSKNAKKQRESRIGRSELIGIGVGVVAVILVAGFILQQVLWKDTWESDNRDAIMRIHDEAISSFKSKGYESAIAKNDELLTLIGDRKIERSELSKAVSETKAVADKANQTLKRQMQRKREGQMLGKLEIQAKALANKEDLESALKAYDQALSLVRNSRTKNPDFAVAVTRITKAKDAVAKQLSLEQEAARKKEEERDRQARQDAEKKRRSTPEAQAFLEAAKSFAMRANVIRHEYYSLSGGVDYAKFSSSVRHLRIAYNQTGKAPNAMCNQVATWMDAYMGKAQNTMKSWQMTLEGNTLMVAEMRRSGLHPTQMLPKLFSIQEKLAAAISELEKKIR